MAKLTDYSKWDNLEDSDEEEVADRRAVQQRQVGRAEQQGRVQTPEEAAGGVNLNDLSLEEQKELVYEWDQGLDEVNIYINPPPGLKANMFDIQITSTHLMVGIKGNTDRFLNVNSRPEVNG
ncbi:hypothetical protein T484DRAFT_1767278 [Baffinella frigidus]|nr:hypothetical protein T484DRAFT_1767278 [Cryptophyta sp. CCMP2293]